ncbi:MAG: MoaD/ThiS family protein [Chloroflexi bacterium]|nr:MoaD/ThiS family protein [Chloroflexota bacterium]
MGEVTVKVCFLGEIRSLVGRREMEVTLPEGSTLRDLFDNLRGSLGEDFANAVFDLDGNLFHHLSISIDGSTVDHSQASEIQLHGGEVDVLILPIYGGGQ